MALFMALLSDSGLFSVRHLTNSAYRHLWAIVNIPITSSLAALRFHHNVLLLGMMVCVLGREGPFVL